MSRDRDPEEGTQPLEISAAHPNPGSASTDSPNHLLLSDPDAKVPVPASAPGTEIPVAGEGMVLEIIIIVGSE